MKNRVATLITLTLLLFGALLVSSARADEFDKKTVFTFSEPIQVPGTVLPAGTYVFKLADTAGDRNVVQIFNADETQLITTILAIPDSTDFPSEKTIITFDERPSGEPEAIKSWFYPGDSYGQEFVYPKQKAVQLAQANNNTVPSIPDEVTEPVAMKTATVTKVSSNPPAPTATEVSSTATVLTVEELPQTGSPLALIALLGLLCFSGAVGIRRFATARK